MIAYRLTRSKYASDLAGTGGLYAVNRCNHKGTPVIYAAQQPSLALAEEALAASTKPDVPVFFVPSVVVPQELNVVMYPRAAGFQAAIIKVEPFPIDERLIGLRKDARLDLP